MLHRANLSPFKAICFSKFILTYFYNFLFLSSLKHHNWVSVHICINQIRFAVSSITQWSSIAPLFPLSEVVLASLLALSLSLFAGISASRTACFWYVVTGSTTLPSVHCLLFLKFSSFLTLRLSHPNRWRQMVTLPVAGSAGDCFLLKGYFSSPLFPSACSKGNNRISPIILSRTVLLTFVGKLHWNDLWLWLGVVWIQMKWSFLCGLICHLYD